MKRSHNLFSRLRRRFSRPVQPQTAVPADDPFFITGAGESRNAPRDRTGYSFRSVIEESLRMWREDPLARRIVNLTTQFSVGRGFRIEADDPASDAFLHEFWEHPLNRMDIRISEWSDELCRTGNLFIMLSSDISGMSYVRAIPASQIEEIIPMPNDIEQPLFFRLKESLPEDPAKIPAEKTVFPASLLEPQGERMLHFTVNRPVGGQWGEPDLAPILEWLHRYRAWLEDRVVLNHFRSCFVFMVKMSSGSETVRKERQAMLNARPPVSGSVLVAASDEEWQTLNPNLDSPNANEDGLAIKKMIAAGAGIPVSFLAESTAVFKADAGEMEDSACRSFRHRQQMLMFTAETILRHVLARGARVRSDLDPNCEIHIYGDDIAAPGMKEGGIVRGI